MRLSIIIPVYKSQETLAACLDSIFPVPADVEVICVDDGSPDDSISILQQYQQKYPTLQIIRQQNGGIASARNAALGKARGEWITFCDPDDTLVPGAVEKILQALDNSCELICWGANIVSEQDLEWMRTAKSYHRIKQEGKKTATPALLGETTVTVWNKAFKRTIIQNNQIVFTQGLFEDNGFYWSYAPYVKQMLFINEYWYNYVQRDSSVFGKLYRGDISYAGNFARVFEALVDFYKKHALWKEYQPYLQIAFKQMFFLSLKLSHKQTAQTCGDFRAVLTSAKFDHPSALMTEVQRGKTIQLVNGEILTGWKWVFCLTNIKDYKHVFLFGHHICQFKRRKK